MRRPPTAARQSAVLFRVAGGPRRGFGHIVRAVRLAQALGEPAVLSVRGTAGTVRTVRFFGASASSVSPTRALAARGLRAVVIDDPHPVHGARWVAAARRRGLVTVSVHDLGLGAPADYQVDGSVGGPWASYASERCLLGPRYAVVDPAVARARAFRLRRGPSSPRVLIALGGGPRRAVARALAVALRRRRPDLQIRIAGGFLASGERASGGVTWLAPCPTLAWELASATVAVVAGGVSLYESIAVGVPTVAGAVVPAQAPAIDAFVAAGAAVGAGPWWGGSVARSTDAAAVAVVRLLDDRAAARRIGTIGRGLVDGHGASRVARAIAAWAGLA